MSNVLYRNFTLDMPLAERAEGSWIWDQKGKKYLDMSGGAFVNALGHGRHDLIQRIADRMKKLSYVNGWHFSSSPMEEYAEKVLKYAPKGMSHVGLLSSGSEAIEAAIKIVRQSFCEQGKNKKHKVIARSPGYHGNVGMAFAASARKNYKKYFSPYITEVAFVSAPQENTEQNINFADELEKKIIELGPETVSTFIVETIMGSSGACSVPPHDYFESIAAVCKKYDVKIIADEVACGAARTGEYFACQHFGFIPDVLVMGKGVNAGLIPTSVLIVSDEIIAKIKKGSGGFMHHQTYMHSPMMAACALEVLVEIEKEKLITRVKDEGVFLGDLLKKELHSLPHVGRVSGKGFFWGITIVKEKNKENKNTFFSADEKIVMKLFKKSKDLGLVLWPVTGEEESMQSDAFVLAPPYTMSRSEMQEGVQKLKELLSF
jgi:adenosylmethionine-8-amino-7-oxononanoate aminotransferase